MSKARNLDSGTWKTRDFLGAGNGKKNMTKWTETMGRRGKRAQRGKRGREMRKRMGEAIKNKIWKHYSIS